MPRRRDEQGKRSGPDAFPGAPALMAVSRVALWAVWGATARIKNRRKSWPGRGHRAEVRCKNGRTKTGPFSATYAGPAAAGRARGRGRRVQSGHAVSAALPMPARPALRTRGAGRLRGQVVYLYAFDVAYDMARRPLPTLLGQPVGTFQMDASKRSPKQLFFYRPQTVRLPPLEKIAAHGGIVRCETVVKIMPVGAVSISVRVPFEVDTLLDLVDYHDLQFKDGSSVSQAARVLGEQVRQELLPYLIKPVATLGDEEAYTAFCIEGPLQRVDAGEGQANAAGGVTAEQWLAAHRRDVSALLTQEEDAELLSVQEAEESSSRYFSYYHDDLCVIDWDAALVVDDPKEFDEALYLMELANVQLAELEAYDRLLDDAVENAYRDLKKRPSWSTAGRTQRELRELRVDAARINDELSNITKFFGDWHLARLYQGVAGRFHLADWHASVRAKLTAIDEIYQLLHADQNHRVLVGLELAVVVLFVIEIVRSFVWH